MIKAPSTLRTIEDVSIAVSSLSEALMATVPLETELPLPGDRLLMTGGLVSNERKLAVTVAGLLATRVVEGLVGLATVTFPVTFQLVNWYPDDGLALMVTVVPC